MPYGWHPYGSEEDADYRTGSAGGADFGPTYTESITATGQDPNKGFDWGWFTGAGGQGAGGNWSSGGPDYQRGSFVPPPTLPPTLPQDKGTITGNTPETYKDSRWIHRTLQWLKNNFHFSMGGGGLSKLLEMLAKGYTGYELYKAVTGDDPEAPGGTGGTGGGKGGGGGGGGKNSYKGAGGVGVYQGLSYQPSFLAWQPTNAGAPQFTSGGPSSLYGTPQPPAPPVAPKKKKKAGA
jgi:hypothetical protein